MLGQAYLLRDESGLVFLSPVKPGRILSDMTLTMILGSTGLAERGTVHGFRSSFKNWSMEMTDTPWAVGRPRLLTPWAIRRNRPTHARICTSDAACLCRSGRTMW